MKSLSLGYSPCPNDTFIFYALVHGKITTGGLSFKEVLEDVEKLNQMAERGDLDITKVSYHAFGHLTQNYCLLRSGGALGRGCGPLLIAREPRSVESLQGATIAVPGLLTTAYLLLRIWCPTLAARIVPMPFDTIIRSLQSGEADAGLIIHESRFTYQKAGLQRLVDLGEWWEAETGLPIPLGGILARRALGRETIQQLEKLLRESAAYAWQHPEEPREYIRRHSQELSDAVMQQHINLYVNDYSLDLGADGERAVEELFRRGVASGILPPFRGQLFID